MKTRYTYLGDNVIEVIVAEDAVEVNVLPADGVIPKRETAPPQETAQPLVAPQAPVRPVAAPLAAEPVIIPDAPAADPVRALEPIGPKKRTVGGVVRAGWFVVFTAAGEALTYALNNLTSLDLPPGTATLVGAVGYGAKKAIWPETTL